MNAARTKPRRPMTAPRFSAVAMAATFVAATDNLTRIARLIPAQT